MAPHSVASEQIIRFCVGTESFRRLNRESFAAAVETVPVESVLALLRNAHQSGMFASLSVEYSSPAVENVRRRLAAFVAARTLFDIHLLAELNYLGERCNAVAPASHPVALKGVSYWSRYYASSLERQVRDLDLLVADPKEMVAVCDLLESEAYEGLRFVGDDRSASELILGGQAFSLPPFRIRRKLDESPDQVAALDQVVAEHGEHLRFEVIDGVGLVMTIDVELHTHLFASLPGQRIPLDRSQLQPSPVIPHVYELTPGTALAYTGAKIVLESLDACATGSDSLKTCKLAADFVRILDSAGQPGLDAAVRVSREWDTLHLFMDALQGTRSFLSDTNLRGFPAPDDDNSFDSLLREALARPAEATAETVTLPTK